MSDAKKCGQCQREIPSHAPFGICPVCVLNLATENSDSMVTDSRSAPKTDSIPEPHELSGKFPNLEILSLLGRGGMGAVYLARQTSLDRTVALKVLSRGLADDPSFTERFAREAKTLAKLTHPNIVTVFDSGQSGDANYLVMEYVEGVNLRDAIVSKTIDPARALAMVQQICDALQHAHDAGVIHRDIKPENILIDRNGLVKIADFGLAKLVQPKPEQYSLTGTRQVLGTRNYMAPEQIESPESVDHRADLYSLGVVLYELLTGELPIGRFAPPSTKSGCSKRLDDLVMRTLEKDPSQRFQQASMIGSAVRELESAIGQQPDKTPLVQAITRTEYARSFAHGLNEPLVDPIPFSISHLKSKPSSKSGNTLNIGKAKGLIHAYDDRIELEFRIHDPMDSDEPVLKKESVELDNLSSVHFEPAWWGGARLRFRGMSLASVEKIPRANQGEFTLNVKQRDRGTASDFADIANRKIVSRNPQRSGAKRNSSFEPTITIEDIVLVDERLKVPCIGFWIAGILTLIAGIILTATSVLSFYNPRLEELFLDTVPVAPIALHAIGPFFLVTWLLPLIVAHSLRRHRNFHLTVVLLLAMVTPWVSPVFLLQIPCAIWALIVLCMPSTRRVFRDASLRERMGKNDKTPTLQRIPGGVFAAIAFGPLLIGFLIFTTLTNYFDAESSLSPGAATPIATPATIVAETQPSAVKSSLPAAPSVHVSAPTAPKATELAHPSTLPEVNSRRPMRTPNRSFKTTISSLGYVGIIFLMFAMSLLAFLLTTLARNMTQAGAGK